MKKLLIAAIFMTCSAQAFAYNWFPVQANCSVSPATARCTVYNRYYRPMICNIQVAGRTYFGYSAFNRATIRVSGGAYGYAHVSANNPYNDPLVRAQASAQCRF
jgi:hypothetical protein